MNVRLWIFFPPAGDDESDGCFLSMEGDCLEAGDGVEVGCCCWWFEDEGDDGRAFRKTQFLYRQQFINEKTHT